MAVHIGFSSPSLTTSHMRWRLLNDQHRNSSGYSHGRHHDDSADAAGAPPVSLSEGLSGSAEGSKEKGDWKDDGIGGGSVEGDSRGIRRCLMEQNGEAETEFVLIGRVEKEEGERVPWRRCVDPSQQEEVEVIILLDDDCHGIKEHNLEHCVGFAYASSMTKAPSSPLEDTNIDPGIMMHAHHNPNSNTAHLIMHAHHNPNSNTAHLIMHTHHSPNCNTAHLILGEVSPPSSLSSPSSSSHCVVKDEKKMVDSKMNLVDPPNHTNNNHALGIWGDHHLPLPYASTIGKASSSLEEAKIDPSKTMHAHHSPIYNAHHLVDEVSSLSPHYVAKDQVVDPPNNHHQDVEILSTHHLPLPRLVDDGDDQAFPCAKRNMNRKLSRVVEESESFLRREFGPSSLEAMSYMNCSGNVGWKSSTTSASMKTSSSWDVAPRSFPKMAVLLLRRGMSDSTILREKSTNQDPKKKEDKKIEAHSHPRTNLDGQQKKKSSNGGGSSKRRITTTSTNTSKSLGGFLWPLKKVRDSYVSCMMSLEGSTTNNICIIPNGLASHHHHFPNRLHLSPS